jgi:hypothetical protein
VDDVLDVHWLVVLGEQRGGAGALVAWLQA